MDYKEEQQQEIEILQSIYPDELELEDDTHFSITLSLETTSDRRHFALLSVEYPDTYPEVVPILSVSFSVEDAEDEEEEYEDSDEEEEVDTSSRPVVIQEIVEFDKNDINEFEQKLNEEAEEQLGIPSIFALASSLKDMAEQKFESKVEQMQRVHDEQLLAKEREEMKKFHGTKVTPESFGQWRLKFRKEMGIDERLEQRKQAYHRGKMTGKEIFEKGLAGDDDIEELSVGVKELSTEA
ncbi:CYFA0S22e00562g1_1 [Cyberlindnera fabianii]|uniref:CYFA0S22e00562g1_1 n=1 Tax=Cyberlindnera fabianii TaxID=36022 RepID=A0A061B9Y0_CYBFA|nr:CYFA0S22e00562g1_1 [Cyberlindnera fabianii]